MKLEAIDITEAVEKARRALQEESGQLSQGLLASLEVILLLVTLLAERLGLNSKNSSTPPSKDPFREKKKKPQSARKTGGQKGHAGTNLQRVENPDHIETIAMDRSTLPQGTLKAVGYEARQVIDLKVSRVVTEYRAERLEDENGKRYTAPFPKGVTRPVQYGNGVKAQVVYLSQYQLIPYNRVEETLKDQAGIPVCQGSINRFIEEAYDRLEPFENIAKARLTEVKLLHADETGVNVDSKGNWLHCVSNEEWTYFYPHPKRGQQAMDEMGVLPYFDGILCHDHWKPYFRYECVHVLCNAHHLREWERVIELEDQQWAKEMKELLLQINQAVHDAGGQLSREDSLKYKAHYQKILDQAHQECPPPETKRTKPGRGRIKRSKARNLLERLINFQEETLRFMDDTIVPFTNNRGENDIRMTKVQQKISGCFRSFKGAAMFCRIRSYLSTCLKHGVKATEALNLLFNGNLPEFLTQNQVD